MPPRTYRAATPTHRFDTKPRPSRPRRKAAIEPVAQPAKCLGPTPCHGDCCLDATYEHCYCSCGDPQCTDCHGSQRFQYRKVRR